MSNTLNLVDQLLTKGRNFHQIGRNHNALQIFGRLTQLGNLPPQTNEETLSRQAEILLGEGRYVKARRHLTALLVQCPDNAHYHYLMASALDNDERADPQRASKHYQRSLQLDSTQPRCLGEYGLLLLRLGKAEEGLAYLRRGVELAPYDPQTVNRLVEGLRQEGLDTEAQDALRVALFRNSRDRRFRQLWNDYQFRALHDTQQREFTHPLSPSEPNQSWILPFVRPAAEQVGDKVVRLDPPSVPQPPHMPKRGQVPGKKRA